MNTLNHKEFIEGYKSGKFSVVVNKNKAGDFVMSKLADKYNKPAHLFWSRLGTILTVPVFIILLFISWKYAVLSLIVGLIVVGAARKSAAQFVLQNMLDNEDFFEYVLLHGGAKVLDEKGELMQSEFLKRMAEKHARSPDQDASDGR